MAKVIEFTGQTTLDLNPDRVLEGLKGKLTGFVLLGYDLEDEGYYSMTFSDKAEVLWLMERFKLSLLNDFEP